MTLYGETRGRTTMRKFPRANTREHTAPKLLNSPSKIHIPTTNSPPRRSRGQKGNKMNDRNTATAARHGLTRTPDTIENYGEHLYFVFHHDKTWEHPVTEQPD